MKILSDVFFMPRWVSNISSAACVGKNCFARTWYLLLCWSVFTGIVAGSFGCTGGPLPSFELVGKTVHPGPAREMNQEYLIGPGDLVELTVLSAPGVAPAEYVLQTGDTILMEFHRNEYLNRNLLIRPDGFVTLPYLGEVQAAGHTASELNETLTKRYRGFFRRPQVTISVVSYNTHFKELLGVITNSATGQSKTMHVGLDGSLSPPFMPKLLVAGRSTAWVQEEMQQAYSKVLGNITVLVDLKEIKSNLVYVLGEVNRPGVINIPAPATVTQMISLAGGYKETASLSSVLLIRPDEGNQPTGRLINVEAIIEKANLGGDELVQRYDVIYVPPSVIHKLNLAILYGIRNMMPLQSSSSIGFTYLWGPSSGFQPF
jgi:protein involved in polysaccharide export with SLBB domain